MTLTYSTVQYSQLSYISARTRKYDSTTQRVSIYKKSKNDDPGYTGLPDYSPESKNEDSGPDTPDFDDSPESKNDIYGEVYTTSLLTCTEMYITGGVYVVDQVSEHF